MTTSWKPWEGKKTSMFSDVRRFLPKNIYGKYTNKDGLELSKARIQELQGELTADNEAKSAALRSRNRQAIRSIPGKLQESIAYLGSDELGDKVPEWMKGGKSWMQPTINPRDVGILPKQIPITVNGKEVNYAIPNRPGSEFTSGGEGLKFKSLAAQERFLEEDKAAVQKSLRAGEASNKLELESKAKLREDGAETVKGSTGSVEETGGLQEEGKGELTNLTNQQKIDAESVGEQETRTPAAIQEQEQGEWGPGGQPSASAQLEAYQKSVPSKTQKAAESTMKISEVAGKAHTVLANLANIASILDTGTGPGATLHKRPSKTDTKTPGAETVKDTKPETVDEKKWRWPYG